MPRWYCWWLKSGDHQLRLVVFPIIYRVSAPFQVVVWDFSHQQWDFSWAQIPFFQFFPAKATWPYTIGMPFLQDEVMTTSVGWCRWSVFFFSVTNISKTGILSLEWHVIIHTYIYILYICIYYIYIYIHIKWCIPIASCPTPAQSKPGFWFGSVFFRCVAT